MKQFFNTFSTTGPSASTQSNNIVPNNGVPAVMKGGRRRRSNKRGGNWGAVLGTAAAPFTLLAAQQAFGKHHTKKHPGHFNSRSRRRR
jgi:hypothetical protein